MNTFEYRYIPMSISKYYLSIVDKPIADLRQLSLKFYRLFNDDKPVNYRYRYILTIKSKIFQV